MESTMLERLGLGSVVVQNIQMSGGRLKASEGSAAQVCMDGQGTSLSRCLMSVIEGRLPAHPSCRVLCIDLALC